MDINRAALIFARQSAIIRTPVDPVWRLLVDINRWPAWNPDIRRAELRGSLGKGALFHWETGAWSMQSTVREVIPHRKLVWSGQAGDVMAIHVWTLVPIAEGISVQAEESWEGASLGRDTRDLQRALEAALVRWLAFLKDDVEHRVRFAQYVMRE